MSPLSSASRLRQSVERFVPRRLRVLSKTAIAFGLVGLGGVVIDAVVFNTLRLGVLGPASSFVSKPLTAGVISASFAIVFNWAGSRFWVFRANRRKDVFREFGEYVLVALLGLGISLLTLAFTHYTLGLTSLAADNVSKNVIGLGLGTVTRFLLLRFWVWGRGRATVSEPAAVTATMQHLGARVDPSGTDAV